MKITRVNATRPAIAAAAAIAIAAGVVPMTTHLSAEPADTAATSPVATSPATTTTATEPAPADTAAPSDATAPDASTPTDSADAAKGDGDTGAAAENADPAATLSPEEKNNMPAASAAQGVATVSPLTKAPKTYKGEDQEWFGKIAFDNKWEAYSVYSPSMGRSIPIAVMKAGEPDAPTVYMLNGAGGSEQDTDWLAMAKGHVNKTLGGQGVNVVIPMEGAFSYYVDWLTDPTAGGKKSSYYHGPQKWMTFLGDELPPAIEKELGTTNPQRAIIGFSMSATSSLLIAEQRPELFTAVGSYSGCAATSRPMPWFATQLTLNRGGATPEQVWGPMGSDYNRYNDALVNAEALKGKAIYVSNGSGLIGKTDMYGYLKKEKGNARKASAAAQTLLVEGGAIEAMTNACTHDLKAKLDSKGIPATFLFRNAGTHSWPYWLYDLTKSWENVIGPRLTGKTPDQLKPKGAAQTSSATADTEIPPAGTPTASAPTEPNPSEPAPTEPNPSEPTPALPTPDKAGTGLTDVDPSA